MKKSHRKSLELATHDRPLVCCVPTHTINTRQVHIQKYSGLVCYNYPGSKPDISPPTNILKYTLARNHVTYVT